MMGIISSSSESLGMREEVEELACRELSDLLSSLLDCSVCVCVCVSVDVSSLFFQN